MEGEGKQVQPLTRVVDWSKRVIHADCQGVAMNPSQCAFVNTVCKDTSDGTRLHSALLGQ
jgi:hypothetical protein